ncbi:MAG: hypothetical protein QM770_13470 [Tepidisphaeraceae bacterium]
MSSDETTSIVCPACGTTVKQPSKGNVYRCEQCGEQFFAPIGQTDPEPDEPSPVADEASLDLKRVQRVMAEHRSLHRLRLWSAGMAIACVLGAGSVAIRTVDYMRASDRRWIWLTPIVIALLYGASRLRSRSTKLASEIETLRLPEPSAPPHFEGLGDGSTVAHRLDELTRHKSADTDRERA